MQSTFINTAYNVNVEFPLAGVGKRLLAWMLDAFIRVVYFIIMTLIIAKIIFSDGFDGETEDFNIAFQLIVYVPLITYYLWQEILFNGQTIGKMACKIKVISLDGYKPTPSQIVNRWLFRIVDFIFLYALFFNIFKDNTYFVIVCFLLNIAAVVITLRSNKIQRIGDIIANTIVVEITKVHSLNDTLYVAVADTYTPKYPQVTKLNDRDISIIKDMLKAFYNTNDHNIIDRSYMKVANALNLTPTESSPELFFERVVADYNYYTTRE